MVLGFEDRMEDIRAFLNKAGGSGRPEPKKLKTKSKRDPKKNRKKLHDPKRIDRFRNVFAKPIQVADKFVAPVHPKSKKEREFLNDTLSDNFIFVHLDSKSKLVLVDAMEPIQCPSGNVLIQQGELGDYMYVLETGKVLFLVNQQQVGEGEGGVCFGELALLYDCPRAATVVCDTDCKLWRVHQTTVRRIKAAKAKTNLKEARDLVNQVSFLQQVNEDTKRRIADALQKKFFKEGETLVHKGSPCESFLIFQQGTVKATDISIGETRFQDVLLEAGDCIGQRVIATGDPWIGNAKAVTNGVYFSLSRENFNKILGGLHLDDLIAKSGEQKLLMAVPILANTDLNRTEIDLMQELLTDRNFHKGHVFCRQGQPVTNPAIYIVRKGTVTVVKNDDKVLSEGEVFGDDELVPPLPNQHQIIAKHTIYASSEVTVGVLSLGEIESVILDASRLGNKQKTDTTTGTAVSLDDLDKHRILGAGTFGQVWLVTQKDGSSGTSSGLIKTVASMSIGSSSGSKKSGGSHKTPYALKIQYKRDLIGYNQVEGVLNEKRIMSMIDHPFVVGLVNSYQDELRIYMLMQLLQGGELFSIIHTNDYDGVPEEEAVFYAAGILEGLSHMHRRKILHRDLKGENVLVDSDGYCVLIDLGFAKLVPDKTYTCCGTPIFMAPEVLLGEGHDHGADIWSLGVLIFDMIVGYTPFYVPGMTQMQLYENIVKSKFYFPDDVEMSPESMNLIRNLLVSDPSFRLGCLTRADLDIRDHPWFKEFDFGKLFRKELEAPWVPDIKDPFDVSQFDDWSELENATKDREPLSENEQALFVDF